MNTTQQTIRYLFLLSALLIAAAYFVGVSTDANAFFAGVQQLGNTFTGRDSKGNFSGYPGANGGNNIQTFYPK